ncbi:MAG TPA: pyridoxal phosphate-dependent aminotransferase [Bacteroidia bacterium]|nr:pyridoxal phosphate-dependent aminotransferase [Bacteroidia bacterium]HNT79484.1 pyridoxal phosphate-dependent aminotransferase [Bacteroidia bacterium]
MPKLSSQAELMPPSPIRKLVPFAENAKKKGVKVYHLNIGQPDIDSPEILLNAIKQYDKKHIEYSHSAGNESYRKKLTAYYSKYDIAVDYSNIMITTGGSEAIEICMQACLNPGEEIIIPEPYYANYNGFSIQAHVNVVPVLSSIKDGFALPPISEFEKLITPKTKAILICNPNNPTGYLYSKDELKSLRDLVLKHDLFLFSDEVYREFCYDGKEYFSVLQLDGLEQHAIMLDSVSKRYNVCGARVGCIVSRNMDLMNASLKFGQARLSPPSLGQHAAEAAIDTPDSYFDGVKNEYIKRRDLVIKELNTIEGVSCPKPSGAFYCVAELPIDDSDKFCQWLLEDFSYENQTVMLAPATGFYSKKEFGIKQVRLAYVLNETELTKALECLKIALEQYPGKTIQSSKTVSQTSIG